MYYHTTILSLSVAKYTEREREQHNTSKTLLLWSKMASSLLLLQSSASPMASQSLSSLSFSRSYSLAATSALSSVSLLPPVSSPSLPTIYCGRGDKKTAKGKRFNHSFGNARPRDKKKGRGPPRVPVPPAPPRKDKYDGGEVVKIEIDESLG